MPYWNGNICVWLYLLTVMNIRQTSYFCARACEKSCLVYNFAISHWIKKMFCANDHNDETTWCGVQEPVGTKFQVIVCKILLFKLLNFLCLHIAWHLFPMDTFLVMIFCISKQICYTIHVHYYLIVTWEDGKQISCFISLIMYHFPWCITHYLLNDVVNDYLHD